MARSIGSQRKKLIGSETRRTEPLFTNTTITTNLYTLKEREIKLGVRGGMIIGSLHRNGGSVTGSDQAHDKEQRERVRAMIPRGETDLRNNALRYGCYAVASSVEEMYEWLRRCCRGSWSLAARLVVTTRSDQTACDHRFDLYLARDDDALQAKLRGWEVHDLNAVRD